MLLEALLEQPVSGSDLELLISDNCSTDDTAAVIDSFRARGLSARYIRNEVNIGPDANFLQCFHEARGKYFWLFGDDDVVAPKALPQIISLLAQGERTQGEQTQDFDLVYLSTYPFSGKYIPRMSGRRRPPLVHFAEVVKRGSYFLSRVHALIGLISCIIVNKNRLVVDGYLPSEKLDKSFILQLAWVLPAIKEKARILYVWERLVAYQTFNSSGWAPCQIFGVNVPRTAAYYFQSEPKLAKSLVNGILRHWLPPVIVDMRLGKHPGLVLEGCTQLLTPLFKTNWRYWLFVYPAAVFPLSVARLLSRVFVFLNRIVRLCRILLQSLFGGLEYYEPR